MRLLTVLGLSLGFTLACAAGKDGKDGEEEEEGVAADADGDGLTDEEEATLGTDPASADSDGDGTSDPDEIDAYTDPLDADDRPYTGGWTMGACRGDIVGEGWEVGQIVEDFALPDQYGELVSVHDFCDRTLLLVFAAFW